MAASNVTSLIISTTTTLGDTMKSYDLVKNEKCFRNSFHEAGRGLHLVKEALQTVNAQIARHGLPREAQNATRSLEACSTKAKLSASIFKDVAQASETSRAEHYKTAVQQIAKGKTAEALTIGMMKDICDLVKNCAIEAKMNDQVKRLRDAIDELSKMEPSVSNEGTGIINNAYDDSKQFNAFGGTQNNNTGDGNQFTGATFAAAVTFGRN